MQVLINMHVINGNIHVACSTFPLPATVDIGTSTTTSVTSTTSLGSGLAKELRYVYKNDIQFNHSLKHS